MNAKPQQRRAQTATARFGIQASIAAFFMLFLTTQVTAQDGNFWQPSDTLQKGRLTLVSAVAGAGFTGTMIGLNELWYSNQPRSSFHFFDDNADWLQMDKAGHAATGYQLSRLGFEATRWTGVEDRRAMMAGAGFAMLFLTGIEVLDGFSTEWGFSLGDFGANVAGGALFVGQQLGWEEQRVALKFSFSPSGLAQYRPETLGSNDLERAIKDYNGQTYWLSVNPGSFRPGGAKLLPWLNVALGYSGFGMLGGAANPDFNNAGDALPEMERYRRYFLSFDVDLTRISTKSKFLRTVFSTFGFVKIPAPAVEFSRGDLYWHWIVF